MKLLLDTHILLWAAIDFARLSPRARRLLSAPDAELLFSVASIWEVAIKTSLGRADFDVDSVTLRRGLLEGGYVELPITGEHAVTAGALPDLHHDPFDRILIAQALVEGVPLVTSDRRIHQYPVPIERV